MAKKPQSAPIADVPPMRIVELHIQNFMRVSEVQIRPDDYLVTIAGENAQGKTSILDAIRAAVRGKSEIVMEPIRAGEERGVIKLNCGNIIITRTFNRTKDGETTTAVTVEDADGKRSSPQEFLNAIVGELAFDPGAFANRMKPEEQYTCLKSLVPGCDFDALEAANLKDFNTRTDINRKAKQLRAQAEGIDVPVDAPRERIDDTAILREIEMAAASNTDIERRRADRDRLLTALARVKESANASLARAAALREEADQLEATARGQLVEAEKEEASIQTGVVIPEPVDISVLSARATEARAHNAIVEKVERRNDLTADAEIEESKAADLTAAIADRERQMREAIEAADLPVKGLSLGDKMVRLNGLPFDQASDAERLRVSIAIGAAMNPTLRVMRVRDGSLLDKQAMQTLADFAFQQNMQIWVERVGTEEPTGFVIENGRVKSNPTSQAAE